MSSIKSVKPTKQMRLDRRANAISNRSIWVLKGDNRFYKPNTPVYRRLISVFDRLKKLLPDNAAIWRHTDWLAPRFSIFNAPETRISEEVWDSIAKALRLHRTLLIEYKPTGSKYAASRKVDPYHTVSYQGEWYLVGRCHYRKRILTFSISRLVKASVSDEESFEYPSDFNFEKFAGVPLRTKDACQ